MTWGEAVTRALRHYANTGRRCEVYRHVLCADWVVVGTMRTRYAPDCSCVGCVWVRRHRNGR